VGKNRQYFIGTVLANSEGTFAPILLTLRIIVVMQLISLWSWCYFDSRVICLCTVCLYSRSTTI